MSLIPCTKLLSSGVTFFSLENSRKQHLTVLPRPAWPLHLWKTWQNDRLHELNDLEALTCKTDFWWTKTWCHSCDGSYHLTFASEHLSASSTCTSGPCLRNVAFRWEARFCTPSLPPSSIRNSLTLPNLSLLHLLRPCVVLSLFILERPWSSLWIWAITIININITILNKSVWKKTGKHFFVVPEGFIVSMRRQPQFL